MKKLGLLFSLFFSLLNINSAQTGLSTAVDFSITDRFGEDHHLYEILNDGKYVLVDFFTTYCENCCEIAPAINELYHDFGCNSQDLYVISIESAGNLPQLETFETICGGQLEKPVATGIEGNGINVSVKYELGAHPTVILIGPDKSIVNPDIWPFTYEIAVDLLADNDILPAYCLLPSGTDDVFDGLKMKLTPNPASISTGIEFHLSESTQCAIQLFNLTGQVVQNVFQGTRNAGIHTIDLDTSDLAAGTYLVRIETEASVPQVRKLVISK